MTNRFWIVHGEPSGRAALVRWLGRGLAQGPPHVDAFEGAPAPDVVVLRVDADMSAALDFAHRISRQHPATGWVLLHDREFLTSDLGEAFRGLDARRLPWPPQRDALVRAMAEAGARERTTGLAGRRQRDSLVRRFARTFGDLDLPDPTRHSPGALVIQGEPGTGRLLLARMIHTLSEGAPGFLHVSCGPELTVADLGRRLGTLPSGPRDRSLVCLEAPERLEPEVQRELRGWIAYGPSAPALPAERLTWIALVEECAGEPYPLEPALADVLSGSRVRLPPLRERPGAATAFAESFARDWCRRRGLAERALADDAIAWLEQEPWVGNVTELEAALARALAGSGSGPLRAADLSAGLGGEEAPGDEAKAETERPPPVTPITPKTAATAAPPAAAAAAPAQPPAGGSQEPVPPAAHTPPHPVPVASPPRVEALATALAHELRNPMVSIRTFAALLPERQGDPAFGEEFRRQVEQDVARMEGRIGRLHDFVELHEPQQKRVDVSGMLERLLVDRRDEIQRRRLLVLRELETEQPYALADEARLDFAFSSLLDAALAHVPDRADLYLAARHHPSGLRDGPAMRILLRFHGEHGAGLADTNSDLSVATSLDLLLARVVIESCDGVLAIETGNEDERVVSVDLPAP
jgi:DNA-binding NtrC family response regulator